LGSAHQTTPVRGAVRRASFALGATLLAALAAPAGALAFRITPLSGHSPNANRINTLYIVTLVFALIIFVAVEGALAYAVLRFRARKGAVAAQIHGNTRLEIGWTVGAALVLVVLAIVTFVELGGIINPPNSGIEGAGLSAGGGPVYASLERRLPPNGKRLEINVVGRQYIWQFVYPGGTGREQFAPPYSYEKLVVPTETTVVLNVTAADVVHSWWVPELGGKVQAVPGYHNFTWFKIPRASGPQIFHGQCASLCGRGHARMIATVEALPPAQFEAWLAKQKQELAEADAEAAKARETLAAHSGPEAVEHP
jgi:cytochrome c oxidase subunit 2